MQNAFSIGESLRFGWAKFKENNGALLGAALVIVIINFFQGQFTSSDGQSNPNAFGLLFFVLSVIVNIGFTIMCLKIARGEKASIREILPPASLGWNIALASFLAGLIIFGGFILLIIPGIYLWIRLSMVSYAVIDGAGVRESLKKSAALTRGSEWRLLGFGLILIVLFILGTIPFGLGLLVVLPVTGIAVAHVYDKLKTAYGHHTHEHSAEHAVHEHHDHSHEHSA